jgi:hypothetical protein
MIHIFLNWYFFPVVVFVASASLVSLSRLLSGESRLLPLPALPAFALGLWLAFWLPLQNTPAVTVTRHDNQKINLTDNDNPES